MRVRLHVEGQADDGPARVALGPMRRLLDALAQSGSLQGAARELAVSYRSAWGQVGALERALGRPLVVKTKGHGSRLTPLGENLRSLLQASHDRLGPALATEQAALTEGLRRLLAPEAPLVRLAASHDSLLLEAIKGLSTFDMQTAGSLEALARLAAGTVDAAGFHYGSEGSAPPPFDRLFHDPAFTVLTLFRREQGLMLAPGNPLGLTSLPGIAAQRARFVNRQRGAGTRIWFERLCAEAGLAPESIVGHHTEEFTHQAVAAIIAAGAADVGMGTRAIAERFGLDFRPLGWETYFLATRAGSDASALKALRADLRCRAERMPGYAPPEVAYRSSA